MAPRKCILVRKHKASSKRKQSTKGSRISSTSGLSQKSKKKYSRYSLQSALRGSTKIPTYKIPKNKLDDALKLLDAEGRNPFRVRECDTGCQLPPGTAGNRQWGQKRDCFRRLLMECRSCLLNRDWANLAAILTIIKPTTRYQCSVYMPVFYRYAVICLLYCGEEETLQNFLESVVGCATDCEKEEFMRGMTSFCEDEIRGENVSDGADDIVEDETQDDAEI